MIHRRGLQWFLLVLTLLLGGVFFHLSPVLAQGMPQNDFSDQTPTAILEATPADESLAVEPSPEPTPDPAMAGVDPAELQKALQAYLQSVETYRNAEQKYSVTRDQYYKLTTLSSLEEASNRAKDLMRERSGVLIGYFTYLRLVVQDTKGIELSDKRAVDSELKFWQEKLAKDADAVSALTTRQEINGSLVQFNEQKDTLINAGYTALALVKIGQTQTAIDNARLVRDQAGGYIETGEVSAADRAMKKRGLEEVDSLLQKASNNLITVREDFHRQAGAVTYDEDSYRSFQSTIEFSYLQLRQSASFLREVVSDLK